MGTEKLTYKSYCQEGNANTENLKFCNLKNLFGTKKYITFAKIFESSRDD